MSSRRSSNAYIRNQEAERLRQERERQREIERKKREERLRREAEQRRREEQRLKQLNNYRNSINSLFVELKVNLNNLNDQISNYNISKSDQGSKHKAIDESKLFVADLQKYLNSYSSKSEDFTYLQNVINQGKNFKSKFVGLTKSLLKESSDNEATVARNLQKQIDQMLSRSSTSQMKTPNIKDTISDLEAQIFWLNKINEQISQIDFNNLSEFLLQKYNKHKNLLQTANSFIEFKKFSLDFIPQFIEKANQYRLEQEQLNTEFSEIYIDYVSLCEECGIPPEQFSVTKENVEKMKTISLDMDNFLLEQKKNNYIKDAINETMAELGLPILATKVQPNSDNTTLNKFLVQFKDDTAIDVTVTEDGHISMEVGLMDNYYRGVTPEEAAHFSLEASKFCEKYKLLQQKLEEKGVILDEGETYPPTSAHAKIIDVSDYNLEVTKNNTLNNADQNNYQENIQQHME